MFLLRYLARCNSLLTIIFICNEYFIKYTYKNALYNIQQQKPIINVSHVILLRYYGVSSRVAKFTIYFGQV